MTDFMRDELGAPKVEGVAQTLCRSKSAVLNMVNVHFL